MTTRGEVAPKGGFGKLNVTVTLMALAALCVTQTDSFRFLLAPDQTADAGLPTVSSADAANAGAADTAEITGTAHAACAAVRMTVLRLTARSARSESCGAVWSSTKLPLSS